MRFNIVFILVAMIVLSSCDMKYKGDIDGDYKVGELLANFSKLANDGGSEQNKIAVFDENIRKIHLFDLNQNKLVSTVNAIEVSNQDKHAILYDANGNYIVDIISGGFAITNKQGISQINPIKLSGGPVSGAFRSDLGLLVIYDDVGSVGLLKLTAQGDIIQSWVGGSRLNSLSSAVISAGDLLDNGHLLISMTDGTLADIDIMQTLSQKKWIYTSVATNLPAAAWVARVPDNSLQVLLRVSDDNDHKIYLFDLATKTVIDSHILQGHLEKSARAIHPHVLISSLDDSSMELFYVENNIIKKIKMPYRKVNYNEKILLSRLNIEKDTFSFVDSKGSIEKSADGELLLNTYRAYRTYKQFRLNDMLLVTTTEIPNGTNVEISDKYIFSLFSNKLGYATNYNIDNKTQFAFEFFNRGYLKK